MQQCTILNLKKQKKKLWKGYSNYVHKTAIWWWNETLHSGLMVTAYASRWLAAVYMK